MGAERKICGARTLGELIELEQCEALAGLQSSISGLGQDLLRATRLEERVRAHPYVWLAGAASAGFLLAPTFTRALGALSPLVRFAAHGLRSLRGNPPSP